MRFDSLWEHQVVSLQLALCVDIWLLKLVILLKPYVAYSKCAVTLGQEGRLADRSIFLACRSARLRDAFRDVWIGRRIIEYFCLFG